MDEKRSVQWLKEQAGLLVSEEIGFGFGFASTKADTSGVPSDGAHAAAVDAMMDDGSGL